MATGLYGTLRHAKARLALERTTSAQLGSFTAPSGTDPTGSPILVGDSVVIVEMSGWEDEIQWVALGGD